MKKNNTKLILVFVIFLILIASAISFYKQEAVQTKFVIPRWSNIVCGRLDPQNKNYFNLEDFYEIKCGVGELTADPCDIYVTIPNLGLIGRGSVDYTIIQDSESTCKGKDMCKSRELNRGYQSVTINSENQEVKIATIQSGQSINLHAELFGGKETTYNVRKHYVEWGLIYTIDGKRQTKAGTCSLTSFKSRIPLQNKDITELKAGHLNDENLGYVNFISSWNYAPPTNIFYHPKYGNVYCMGGMIYTLNELTTADFNKHYISVKDYYDTTGDKYIMPSEPIDDPDVECCPKQTSISKDGTALVCGDDFKFHPTNRQKCYQTIDCSHSGNWVYNNNKQIVRFKCISGYCQPEYKDVECAFNGDCPQTQYCDKSTWTCKDRTGQTEYCGDGICSRGETPTNCYADCGAKQGSGMNFNLNNYMPYIIAGILVIILVALLRPTKKK